jgi:malonate-semialdehyde dehydrogenase (acetylating)/methylmalonate-semialdehyde dehydrogenase
VDIPGGHCIGQLLLKPSPIDPSASMFMADLLQTRLACRQRVQCHWGDKEAGRCAAGASDVKAVSFVGSTPIANPHHETGAHHDAKRVQALGGAKNHMVVMPDAPTWSRRSMR